MASPGPLHDKARTRDNTTSSSNPSGKQASAGGEVDEDAEFVVDEDVSVTSSLERRRRSPDNGRFEEEEEDDDERRRRSRFFFKYPPSLNQPNKGSLTQFQTRKIVSPIQNEVLSLL